MSGPSVGYAAAVLWAPNMTAHVGKEFPTSTRKMIRRIAGRDFRVDDPLDRQTDELLRAKVFTIPEASNIDSGRLPPQCSLHYFAEFQASDQLGRSFQQRMGASRSLYGQESLTPSTNHFTTDKEMFKPREQISGLAVAEETVVVRGTWSITVNILKNWDFSDGESECTICYNDYRRRFEVPYQFKECNHIFGSVCITKWLRTADSCPACRIKICNL